MAENLIPVFCKALGVEIGEEFYLKVFKYRFTDTQLEFFWDVDQRWMKSGMTINDVLNCKIIKIPDSSTCGSSGTK